MSAAIYNSHRASADRCNQYLTIYVPSSSTTAWFSAASLRSERLIESPKFLALITPPFGNSTKGTAAPTTRMILEVRSIGAVLPVTRTLLSMTIPSRSYCAGTSRYGAILKNLCSPGHGPCEQQVFRRLSSQTCTSDFPLTSAQIQNCLSCLIT